MHVYRFRSSGLMSQKSVLYDEMYFASTEELNDPIDMRSHFVFSGDSKKNWSKVLDVVWGEHCVSLNSEMISSYLSDLCPIDYFELINRKTEIKEHIFKLCFESGKLNLNFTGRVFQLINKFISFIELYQPNTGYSVSLSKVNNETLMWSHYASSHKGFCLIFKTINNEISQCEERKKSSIEVSNGHSTTIPENFSVSEITYNNQVSPIDAFTVFPAACSTLVVSSHDDRIKYHENKRRHLTTKSECWDYEQEVRLLIESPSRYISGEGILKPYKRLFHYDFSQVVGVIFGARIPESEKEALKHILTEKLKKESLNAGSAENKILFDFMFQQANLSSDSRKVIINNIGAMCAGGYVSASDKQFARVFSEWKKGGALVFQNGSCTKEYF